MFTKRYNLINNVTGVIVFAIALITYWLTLEPTASYWDCGEFIVQADKLEIGHPPGNPIFMLTARFFANFASDAAHISVMVNAMSGLLSALTILLLFWTITHLCRRLIVKDGREAEPTLQQYLAIMGSGVVGALAYCWSDTFWFSAVEGEVYAFSSFCTALVFWLILKWENRADEPHSDRWLLLIAYIIGVSVAVHLLNLLCIPAVVLVYAFRKWKDVSLVKALLALLVSFVIVALVLFGLVPGIIKVAQRFELLFVNDFHCSFNSGAMAYAIIASLCFIWAIYELYSQKSPLRIKISFLVSVTLSGMLFMGSGWALGWILTFCLAAWLFVFFKVKPEFRLPVRGLNIVLWSIALIFVGYSSYAVILIRSSADTPMNQNSPDNVFDLAAYLNREQYGEKPLLYGETLYSSPMRKVQAVVPDTIYVYEDGTPLVVQTPIYQNVIEKGQPIYAKGVHGTVPTSEYGFLNTEETAYNAKRDAEGGDYYVKRDYKPEIKMVPQLNMLFPRIYSRMHASSYGTWVNLDTMPDNIVMLEAVDGVSGEKVTELDVYGEPDFNEHTGAINYRPKYGYKPTFGQNMQYFFNYQLNHMYLRYFMWNFAGRQNDILNTQGEADAGNWISGIPAIDNSRLGDQSLLPDELGNGNAGHNVYYMLPLLLGIIGLLWQAFAGKRGVEQFWVVFFLFFMTGIAIVLYLNDTPNQPRERDYVYAGSFYAYAIWIGMGVAGLWRIIKWIMNPDKSRRNLAEEPEQLSSMTEEPEKTWAISRYAVIVACLIGIAVPLQMVSQTWDDHDRSGRYAARDFGRNYLESLEPNAIVFCNGDNDTFPLWYAQEVEGVRPDVKIINLSYLNSDWYANQQRKQSYEAAPVKMTATPGDYAYGKADVTVLGRETAPADLLTSLKMIYSGKSKSPESGYNMLPSRVVTIPVDRKKVIERGLVEPYDTAYIVNNIVINLGNSSSVARKGYVSLGELLMLDIIATNAANGWERPIYWCSTVGDEYHMELTPYLRGVGMANQLVPTIQDGMPVRSEKAYDVITRKYRWGGADKATADNKPYYDETARRMLLTTETSMLDLASELIYRGDQLKKTDSKAATGEYRKAVNVLNMMENKLSEHVMPYPVSIALQLGQLYGELGQKERLNDTKLTKKGVDRLWKLLQRALPYLEYSRMMTSTFGGGKALTVESRLIPYQYYHFAELYQQFGGDKARLDQLLKSKGFTLEELKNNYERAYGGDATAGSDYSSAEYLSEVHRYVDSVVKLQSLGAAEYASSSEEARQIDSLFYVLTQSLGDYGLSKSDLDSYAPFKKVDLERSRKLYESYSRH